ncbi:MAG: hypothetical protein WC684_08630 [Hyphomicrobium sp.]|jgi:hypothetical protein
MTTSKLFKRIILAVVGTAAALAMSTVAMIALLAIADPFGGPPHPTDAAMLAQFARVRPSLEEIVGMIEQDPGIERLAPDFTRPEPAPIGLDRLADYRTRLQAAGIAHGLSRYGDAVAFLVSTQGLAISGSGKSFVHAGDADPDATVIDGDLDAAVIALADKDVLLQRRIGEGWWLQLDRR